MPSGIYKRTFETIEKMKLRMIGNTYGFKKGKSPWNKGKKGLQIAWNKGIPAPWLKGNKFAVGSGGWNKGKKFTKEEIEAGYGNWKGGISKDKHRGDKYIQWRESVFKRDNWTCLVCKKRGIYIEAHHIFSWREYPNLRYQTNNGITLCRTDHPRKRSEEVKLLPYFQSLVAEIN